MNSKKILFLIFSCLVSDCLFSQPNSIKIDTAYYRTPDQKIQTITETTGNKKTVASFYQNGTKQSLEFFIDNKLDGTILRWYQNGQKQNESTYSNGALVKRMQWYQNGISDKEENYKLIKKDSIWQSFLDGKYRKNSVSGLPVTEGNYQNQKKNGEWTEYYESGNKKSAINYKDDIRNGKATYWSKGGKIAGEYNYATEIKNEKPREVQHGKQIRYFENGNVAEKSNYNMGEKDGFIEEWYENGNKKSETEFKNNLVNGKNKLWFPNGKVQQEMSFTLVFDSVKKFNRPRYESKYEIYYDNGNLKTSGNYVAGKEEGLFLNFYDNGQKSGEINYKNGLKAGTSTLWHKNGNISQVESYIIIKENDSIKSVLDGEFSRYIENNTLVEKGSNKNGKKEGLWTQWFPDGTKANETSYRDGLKYGKSISWNKDGSLKQEQSYIIVSVNGTNQNVLEGEEKIFDNQGVLSRINYYNRKNYCCKTEEFYEDKTIKSVTYHLVKSEYNYPQSGRNTTYFSNGQLESESFYYDGSAVGRTLNYFINGNLKSVADVDAKGRGNKFGYEIQWSSDGELTSFRKYSSYKDFEDVKDVSLAISIYEKYMNLPKAQGNSVNGLKEGLWISWFDAEHKQFEENFKNGKLDGYFAAYYPGGKKLFETEMKDAVPNGKFTLWSSLGKKYQEGSYADGVKTGTWINYFDNGNKHEETVHEVGQKQYVSRKEWYENGNQKSEAHYVNGIQNGYFADWYENGILNNESNWVDGKLEGTTKSFYKNGNKRNQNSYKNNLKEGVAFDWFENGKDNQVCCYKNGKREGLYKRWWENGNLRIEGFYREDEQDSIWTSYFENGQLERKSNYVKGMLQVTPSGFDCECIDSTKRKLSFAPLITSLASLETVRKMSFNIHAPIGDFYNHLFYIGLQSDAGRNASFYTFDIIAYQQMFLQIPDEKGIKLILNPCLTIGSKESRINFNISTETENKENTRATLEAKYLSIEFNPQLLHQWDKKSSSPFYTPLPVKKNNNDSIMKEEKNNHKNNFVPAILLFKSESVDYNETDHLKVNGVKEPCFTTSEIGNSGILLDFKNMILDLDAAKNPEMIEWALPKKYFEYYYDYEKHNYKNAGKTDKLFGKAKENFVGVFVSESQITLPDEMFQSKSKNPVIAKGKNFMLSGQYIIGTIHIKAALSEGLNYLVDAKDEKIIFNASSIENLLQAKGFNKVRTEYDTKSSEFIIYFYYSLN